MKKIVMLMGAALVSLSVNAQAAEDNYVGVKIGQARTASTAVMTDKRDTAFGVYGGHRYNKNWAAEVAYTDLGNFTSVAGQSSAYAVEMSAVGTINVTEKAGVFGKLGVAHTATSGNALGASASNNDLTYGVGATYRLTDNVDVRAAYDRYRLNGVGASGDSNIYSIGAGYRF